MGIFWKTLFAVCSMPSLFALQQLSDKYLVSYGDSNAPIHVTEYFSFQCPFCISIFRKDFKNIQTQFIDTKKVYWTFHPIPTDLATVQGMICLANLGDNHRKLFLETLLTEAECASPALTSLIMSKVMEILKKPLPNLQEEEFIKKTDTFSDAYTFLTQDEKISAVPTVQIGLKLFPNEVPDFDFVKTIVEKH